MQHSQPETHLGTHLPCEHLSLDKPLEELSARHPGTDPLRHLAQVPAPTLLQDGQES